MLVGVLIFMFLVTIVYAILSQIYLGSSILVIVYIITMGCLCFGLYMILHIQKKRYLSQLIDVIQGTAKGKQYDEDELGIIAHSIYELTSRNTLITQRAKGDRENLAALVADISHQSKTPLSNIILYTDMCIQSANKEQKKYLSTIQGQAEKLKFLFEALTKLSRCECGLVEQNIRVMKNSVSELLAKSLDGIYLLANQKQIEILIEETHGEMAYFDLKWTSEALATVLDNAVKYTQPHGKIHIQIDTMDFYLCILISDTGIGISNTELPKIFDRFYRGMNSTGDGVGIGLYLASKILTTQHGYITAESKPAHGSLFRVYLPLNNRSVDAEIKSDESVSF